MSTFVKQAEIAVDHLDWGDDRLARAPGEHRLQDVRRDGRDARARLRARLPQAPRAGRDDHRQGRQDRAVDRRGAHDPRGRRLGLPRRRTSCTPRSTSASETAHLQVVLAPAVGDEGYQLVDVSGRGSPGPRCAASTIAAAAPHRASRLRRGRAREHARGVHGRDRARRGRPRGGRAPAPRRRARRTPRPRRRAGRAAARRRARAGRRHRASISTSISRPAASSSR